MCVCTVLSNVTLKTQVQEGTLKRLAYFSSNMSVLQNLFSLQFWSKRDSIYNELRGNSYITYLMYTGCIIIQL